MEKPIDNSDVACDVPRWSRTRRRGCIRQSPCSQIRPPVEAQVLRVAAAGNAGRDCPPADLEATGDRTMRTQSHSCLHDQPDFHVSSWSGVMAKPAEQTQEDPDRWRSKYSHKSLQSCNQRCSAAGPLQPRNQCSRASPPGRKTAGLGSHVGQAV